MIPNYKLVLTHATGVNLLHPNEIIRIEAISNYSKIYFTNGKTLVVAKVLKWFDEKLTNTGFIRIHRSHLINTQAVTNITYGCIQLNHQTWLVVSKRKRKSCIRLLLFRDAA